MCPNRIVEVIAVPVGGGVVYSVVVNTLVSVNEVARHQARLLLGWVTAG